jgi:hypothetical protein
MNFSGELNTINYNNEDSCEINISFLEIFKEKFQEKVLNKFYIWQMFGSFVKFVCFQADCAAVRFNNYVQHAAFGLRNGN